MFSLNPNQSNLQAGSQGYQAQVVQNADQSSKPYYQRAARSAMQTAANRGTLDSGYGQQQVAQPGEDRLAALAGTAGNAAVGAADLAESNRRRAEGRQWELQDMNTKHQWDLEDQARSKDAQDQASWRQMLGGIGGAAAGALGGPLGIAGGTWLSRYLSGGGQQQPQAGDPNYTTPPDYPGDSQYQNYVQ